MADEDFTPEELELLDEMIADLKAINQRMTNMIERDKNGQARFNQLMAQMAPSTTPLNGKTKSISNIASAGEKNSGAESIWEEDDQIEDLDEESLDLVHSKKEVQVIGILNNGGLVTDMGKRLLQPFVLINQQTKCTSSNFVPGVFNSNRLLDLYTKCGSLVDAQKVFDEMGNKDLCHHCVIITVLESIEPLLCQTDKHQLLLLAPVSPRLPPKPPDVSYCTKGFSEPSHSSFKRCGGTWKLKMAKVATASSVHASSCRIGLGPPKGGGGSMVKLKRKTPSELREEQLKRASDVDHNENVVDQTDESSFPLDGSSSNNTTKVDNGFKKQGLSRTRRYTDTRVDEVFNAKNSRFNIATGKENALLKKTSILKNLSVFSNSETTRQQGNSCLKKVVASTEVSKDGVLQSCQTTEKCSQGNFVSVSELSSAANRSSGLTAPVDMGKALRELFALDPNVGIGSAFTGNFFSECHVPGQKAPLDLTLKTSMRVNCSSSVNWIHRLALCGTMPFESQKMRVSQGFKVLNSCIYPQSVISFSLISVLSSSIAGSRIGPGGLGFVSEIVQVETTAQFRVIFVFFSLDLEFSTINLKVVREMTILGGLLQIFLIMCLCGITALLCVGKSSEEMINGTYLSMSLTAMVLKFLMERNSIKTFHGQVTIGTLMLQDCANGLLFAMLLVLGGTSGVLQGLISFTKSLLILITILAILSILSSTWLPWFLKLMISLSSQTNELYKHGLVQHVTQFLSSNGLTNLSRLTSDGFIGLLVKISSGSIVAFRTLHELNISSTLRDILSTSDLSHGVSTSQFVRGVCNLLIWPVISGIQLSSDSSQRSTSREALNCLFSAFPSGKSPTISNYTADPHDPLSLQDLLLQRDLVLTQLKSNLLKAEQIPQLLIQWEGTDRHKATWEDLSYIVEYPNFNLEDKVDFYRGGNVTNTGQAEAREELKELVIPVGHVYGDEAINGNRKSERKRATGIALKNYVWK